MAEMSRQRASLSICGGLTKSDFKLQGRLDNSLPKVGHAKSYVTNKHPGSRSIAIRNGCSVSYRRISPSVAPPAASHKGPRGRICPTKPAINITNEMTKRIHVNASVVNTRVSRELKRRPT